MWLLNNLTPYAVESTWIRDTDGAEIWIVAVKASYELQSDGSLCVAQKQPPINSGIVLHEDGVSPIFETDMGPPKAATDVWLVGHAHSQDGKPVSEMQAGFSVGSVKREFTVVGDRELFLGMKASAPNAFTNMPLTWARAFGGGGPDCSSGNPVGCGKGKGNRLPNILPASMLSQGLGQTVSGVGPIPRHWPERAKSAGTYDNTWQTMRAPLLPLDLKPEHWQVAPKEQQVQGYIKGGEAVVLHNLTPAGFVRGGTIHTKLPRVSLSFRTRFYGSGAVSTRSQIHNVILQPDGYQGSGPLISVVHHMHLPCHAQVNQLATTTITEKSRPLDTGGVQTRMQRS